jgi:hypothetical protein
MDDFQLLETVIATVDMPDEGVIKGDVGTIIDVYAEIATAYEVEFANADGSTRTQVTLAPGQFRHLAPGDILTTRQKES